jgi:hypothetical protein
MDDQDRTAPTGLIVPIPEHLVPTIFEVVERQLEIACDGTWNDMQRIRVLEAARFWEAFMANTVTAKQIAELAKSAADWIQPRWPQTTEAVRDVEKLLAETRELLELHDRALAIAREQEAQEPAPEDDEM